MNRNISLISVPFDLGGNNSGTDLGPRVIRYAGLEERIVRLGYSIESMEAALGHRPSSVPEPYMNHHYYTEVLQANTELAAAVSGEIARERFPLLLGGDHSIAIGSIAGIAGHKRNLGVIWIDAHADINTGECSISGNTHGMSLAAGLGLGDAGLTGIGGFAPKIKPENVVYIGLRDLDEAERQCIHDMGIKAFSMREIDRYGIVKVMEDTLNYIGSDKDGVHLSFDFDVLDAAVAKGVSTPKGRGITVREAHVILEMLSEANVLTSAEFVELTPIFDEQHNTAKLAVDLIASLFGETIL